MKLINTENNICCYFPYDPMVSEGRVFAVGSQMIMPNQQYPLEGFPNNSLFNDDSGRCIDTFQIVLISEGNGFFIDRGIEHQVSEGAVFLIRPNTWHSYAPSTHTGWKEHYIAFDGELFSKLISQWFPEQESNVFRVNSDLKDDFDKILQFARNENEDTPLILKSMLSLMISKIAFGKISDTSNKNRSVRIIARARAYMEMNISCQFNLDELARGLGMSYTSFNTHFKEQLGMSPIRFLRNLRLQKAKYQLLKTNNTIKEIARECGFTSTEYFCNSFRNENGISPLTFREEKHRK